MYPDRNVPLKGDIVRLPCGDIALVSDGSGEAVGYEIVHVEGLSKSKCRSVSADELEYNLETGRATIIAGQTTSPRERWWIEGCSPPTPNIRTADLSFQKVSSRTLINGILDHPLIDHELGGVAKGKAMFTATAGASDNVVAVAVLDRPARAIDDYQRLTLSRYASHPAAPPNTASWMVSRVCDWATARGYRTLRTYAGVSNDNEGTIYQASGFTFAGTSKATGEGFANRPGRERLDDFRRRIYYRRLAPLAIRVPDPETELPVEVPDSHQQPVDVATDPTATLEDLSSYLDTDATHQRQTLTSQPSTGSDEFLSPDDVGLVDFEHHPALLDALATDLPITEQAISTRLTADSRCLPTDSLLADPTTPIAVLGTHHQGRLTTALVIHEAAALVDTPDDLPSPVASPDHVVTAFGTTASRGHTNVSAWLLAVARTRAAFDQATLHVPRSLSTLQPARRRASIPTADFDPAYRLSNRPNSRRQIGQ